MFMFIAYGKLKSRLQELGYSKAEIKSTVSQVRGFDKDIKKAVKYWLETDEIPGDSDPAFVVGDKYSIQVLCDDFGFKVPAAFILLQSSRENYEKTLQLIYSASIAKAPEVDEDEMAEICKRFGIDMNESEPENDEDVVIESKGEN